MKGDPEQRAVQLGEYIAANRATVRAAAAVFGCSKSTVHKDVAVRLGRCSRSCSGRCVRFWPAIRQSGICAAVRPPGANTAADKKTAHFRTKRRLCRLFKVQSRCGTGSVRLFPTG